MNRVLASHRSSNDVALRIKPLYAHLMFAIGAYGMSADAVAGAATASASVGFDSGFFAQEDGREIDLSRFERGNLMTPGTHSVDVFVNENRVGRMDVPFTVDVGDVEAEPCLDTTILQRMQVDLDTMTVEAAARFAAGIQCLHIDQVLQDASSAFDFGEQQLYISIPQASLIQNARGYVSPALWDAGVNAGMLGYDLNLYSVKDDGGETQTQGYVGLNAGLNVGHWHFRHNGSYSFDSSGNRDYQSIDSYVQRDIPALTSQLTIGEAYTSGDLFDSTPFVGVRLASDDRMLPASLRGYAPTVRGIARSNARVTIRQNDVVIHEVTVAPGAFEIDDLYATGYGGDLDVTVQEADGSKHSFSVPYAAVPQSLRPGANRFSVVGGAVRSNGQLSEEPLFVQGTWQRGFTNMMTGYAGVTAAKGYSAILAGGAFNTDWGALGLDITRSNVELDGKRHTGASARASYSKNLADSGTHIALAGYRYSTDGFVGFNDAMDLRYGAGDSALPDDDFLRQRNRASLTLSQRLGDNGGSLSVTGSAVDYWNRAGKDIDYSLSYSNTYKSAGYNLSVNRQRNEDGVMDTVYTVGLSVPLGKSRRNSFASNVSRDTSGRMQAQARLSGAAGEHNNLSYGISVNHDSGMGESRTSGSANVGYRASAAELTASLGVGSGYAQGSLGVRGAVVAHPGGVTFSQPLSETIGIIEAKDAEGARLLNASGVRVDRRGYAVVPYLTPYATNTLELDPKGLPMEVELQITSQQVVPRAGAVAMIKYATASGRSAVLEAVQANGDALPFGATVFNEQGQELGVVGQASRIFARGLDDSGRLVVTWGEDSASSCYIDYALPAREKGSTGYQNINANCSAQGASTAREAWPGTGYTKSESGTGASQ